MQQERTLSLHDDGLWGLEFIDMSSLRVPCISE